VFAERGYTGATTAQICRAAGVGSGTLFHYFGDKRSIMLAIFADDQAVNDAESAGILDDGDRRVRTTFARLLTRAQADGDVDPGLDPERAGRWLLGLVDTLHLMCGDEDFDAAAETAELRHIVARYFTPRD
jgi:AcrR family transcriptional regulator